MTTRTGAWTIQDLARATGTTSRTLRHYTDLGLLTAGRNGTGMRTYGEDQLPRLLRILLLRDLGVPLARIGEVLAEEVDQADALAGHLEELTAQRERLERRIASVEHTLHALKTGEPLMPQDVFDGFDHTQYREEVEHRWGKTAYADATRRWEAMSADEQAAHQREHTDIAQRWAQLASAGAAPDGDEAQETAARHVAWLSVMGRPSRDYARGLAEMYVADPRFAANYHGAATFVRDALVAYADRELA